MFDCVAVGDSIAVGVGQALHCSVHAKVGASSTAIVSYARGNGFCIVSAGSNDPYNPNLRKNLEKIRSKLNSCDKLVWIIPQNGKAAAVVRSVAAKHGDYTVSFKAGPDGVHPKSYSELANKVKR